MWKSVYELLTYFHKAKQLAGIFLTYSNLFLTSTILQKVARKIVCIVHMLDVDGHGFNKTCYLYLCCDSLPEHYFAPPFPILSVTHTVLQKKPFLQKLMSLKSKYFYHIALKIAD